MKLAFVHNVHNRYQTLEYNVNLHSKYFPSADTYIMYNLKSYEDTALYLDSKIKSKYFPNTEHKLGCMNGFIFGIKETLNKEYDVVIFSHDDVYINESYIDVVQDKIQLIYSNSYSFIGRRPLTNGNYNIFGKDYLMMECLYLHGNYVKESFSPLKPLSSEKQLIDSKNRISPEWYLYTLLDSNGLIIDYDHKLKDYNETFGKTLGFYHKNAGERGWTD